MENFRALRVHQDKSGNFYRRVEERSVDELPPGELLVQVQYSSLNFKDVLSATGAKGVTRHYPHTPGIDIVGTVIESTGKRIRCGEQVIATGFNIGMDTDGGFGQLARIPENWALLKPTKLDTLDSMVLGTAGLTAALSISKLEQFGMKPDLGPILVTGATGGVGCIATALLSQIGYTVHVVTGKQHQHDFLRSLGANDMLSREDALERIDRPLQKEQWGGVVDTVGGDTLMNAIKGLRRECSATTCGLVSSPFFRGSVLPFILRHVNLLGIDTAELALAQRANLWGRLANEWKVQHLARIHTETFTLQNLEAGIAKILCGEMVGRGVVDLQNS
ncbi:MAG: YhdH/YhfP family quinone oxidoreductase [Gammaproteobacteria bacterium]|nr:YhdH/YhfP family quinone oxidoreductase [Gammaproteobacteria bacterium]MXX95339.1 YhdH/YhfP family quinone oxidoreductase [Gammaproteobacteria bacterium]MYF52752.1 YhdH/YhfP family quinone oxidoreductase [Gammaproteobacteria bacterium]MYK42995.1 YhdH/YhfP family quinone oxidoreductase [Gammaproteobacteria bacterium]